MASSSTDKTTRRRSPVMTVTRYDIVNALMIAVVGGLAMTVITLVIIWLTNRIPEPDAPPMLELLELPGGFEDGAIDETLKVDSEEELREDPAVAETPSEQTEIQEMLDTVMELSDQATQMAQQQFQDNPSNEGTPGRAEGNGRRPFGSGGPGAGIGRDQRWFISFTDSTETAYARQLDFFGIELGAFDGRQLIYIKNLSSPNPEKRVRTVGKGEERLRFNWKGGERRRVDNALFKKAGVNAENSLIFHFYPPPTEQILARLELAYAGRPVKEIRRTYFSVRSEGNGYRFVVTRQLYLK